MNLCLRAQSFKDELEADWSPKEYLGVQCWDRIGISRTSSSLMLVRYWFRDCELGLIGEGLCLHFPWHPLMRASKVLSRSYCTIGWEGGWGEGTKVERIHFCTHTVVFFFFACQWCLYFSPDFLPTTLGDSTRSYSNPFDEGESCDWLGYWYS